MRFPPPVKYLLPEVRDDDAFIFELVLNLLLVALRAFTRRQQPPPDDKDDTEAFCEKKLMMTERERREFMRENEDKMEELESSLFSQRSSFRSNRGSVSVAFFFPPARFEEHVTRAFRRLPLAWTAQVYARFLSFEKGVRVSKHTLRPLSDLTTCLFSRPRRRRHWEEEKRAADGRT